MKKISQIYDISVSILALIILALHYTKTLTQYDEIILILGAIIGTIPVIVGAIQGLIKKDWASMDMLASIALVFSILDSEWASAVFITLMLSSARILENITEDKTEKNIKSLLKLRPEKALVERNGQTQKINISEIRLGDTVIVDVSERIPIDGTILSGQGSIDESSLTGESLPVDKTTGQKVKSSTLVISGSFKIIAEKVGNDTTFERIIDLIERSRKEKPRSATMGEKFGKTYLIFMLIGSILIYILTKNTSLVLAIVLVVCADDVAVAIPLAYLRAISSATKRGIIIKGGRHLEMLSNVKTIVFDKTGTLTQNKLKVAKILPEEFHTESEVINIAAMIAKRSDHPMSRAISQYADIHKIHTDYPDQAESFAGKGIIAEKNKDKIIMGRLRFLKDQNVSFSINFIEEATRLEKNGLSLTFVALNNKALGSIAIEDMIKPDARDTISRLKKLKIHNTVMLTGDNSEVAKKIAMETKVDHFHSGLMPEDKVNIIKDWHHKGDVAMVGDGINDAAALSVSSVGIAMGGIGTDGAIESADIVLMKDKLSSIPEVIYLARKTKRIAKQDFYIWGATNILGLCLVLFGFIGPSGAAAYNFISDFLPLVNSARAKIDEKYILGQD